MSFSIASMRSSRISQRSEPEGANQQLERREHQDRLERYREHRDGICDPESCEYRHD